MKNIQLVLILTLTLIICFSCNKDGGEALDVLTEEAFNDLFIGGDIEMNPDPSYEETTMPAKVEKASNGRDFLCNGKRVKETVVIDQLTLNAFDDRAATNTAALYPGSIIKIRDFKEVNDLSGIGGVIRSPIQISSDLGDIRMVDDPSQRGNVDKAIKEIEEANPNFAANVRSESTEAYSLEQSMLHIGVDARYLGQSVKGRFDFSQTLEQHSFVVKFYQIYHTASVQNPGSPADLFDNANHPDDLKRVLDASGPLGLITEVAYGRMLIGILTYKGSSFSSSAQIEGEFRKGLASVDGKLDASAQGFFKNSTFKVAILGGDASEASSVAGAGLGMEAIQAAYKWMKDGGNDPSLGVPIQYKIRQLNDPSYPLLAISGAVDYEVPDCSRLPNRLTISKFELKSYPALNPDNKTWDIGLSDNDLNPDAVFYFQKYVNNDWEWLARFEDKEWPNLKSSELPKTLDVNIPVPEKDFRATHFVQFYDKDVLSDYDLVGDKSFSFGSYLRSASNPNPSNPYPSSIELSNGGFSFKLHLTWE